MRTITITALALLAGCSSSCGGANQPHVSWPSVVACGNVVRDALLYSVQMVLAGSDPEMGDSSTISDRAVSELERMAQEHGAQVIACIVDQAVHSFDQVATAGAVASVPAEQPKARGLFAAPAAPPPPPDSGVPVPVATEPGDAAVAAARGRDFLQRVAHTHVEGDDR